MTTSILLGAKSLHWKATMKKRYLSKKSFLFCRNILFLLYIYGARWMDYIHSLKLKIVFPSCCSLAGNKKIDDVKSILKSLLEFIPMMSDRWIVDTHCNVSKSYPIFWHRKHIFSDITTPEMAIISTASYPVNDVSQDDIVHILH